MEKDRDRENQKEQEKETEKENDIGDQIQLNTIQYKTPSAMQMHGERE